MIVEAGCIQIQSFFMLFFCARKNITTLKCHFEESLTGNFEKGYSLCGFEKWTCSTFACNESFQCSVDIKYLHLLRCWNLYKTEVWTLLMITRKSRNHFSLSVFQTIAQLHMCVYNIANSLCQIQINNIYYLPVYVCMCKWPYVNYHIIIFKQLLKIHLLYYEIPAKMMIDFKGLILSTFRFTCDVLTFNCIYENLIFKCELFLIDYFIALKEKLKNEIALHVQVQLSLASMSTGPLHSISGLTKRFKINLTLNTNNYGANLRKCGHFYLSSFQLRRF